MRPAARGVSLKELTGNMQLKPRVLLVEHRSDLAAMYQLAFEDRKSTRLNSSHLVISYAVFCLKKKKQPNQPPAQALCHHLIDLDTISAGTNHPCSDTCDFHRMCGVASDIISHLAHCQDIECVP